MIFMLNITQQEQLQVSFSPNALLLPQKVMLSQVLLQSSMMSKPKAGRELSMPSMRKVELSITRFGTVAEQFTPTMLVDSRPMDLQQLLFQELFTQRMEEKTTLPQLLQLKKISKDSSKISEEVLKIARELASTESNYMVLMVTLLISSYKRAATKEMMNMVLVHSRTDPDSYSKFLTNSLKFMELTESESSSHPFAHTTAKALQTQLV
jgi:hypothetical protein